MVPDLEQVHRAHRPKERGLRRESRIAREQRLEIAVGHEQHDRVLVDVGTPAGPIRRRMQHGESHPIEHEPLPRAGRVPPYAVVIEPGEQRRIARIGSRARGLDDEPHRKAAEHRPDAAHVIGVRVRDDEGGQGANAVPLQKGHHHSATRVVPLPGGPRIDDHPAPTGRSDCRPVSLPYVEKM